MSDCDELKARFETVQELRVGLAKRLGVEFVGASVPVETTAIRRLDELEAKLSKESKP